ncbi:zinc finger MYM-type protein 1-like [Oratosquilla oratoria]|uniref:zinc finger MYM-type protein 1-like n=1 Tax=Oratosquilla oratoria TaxID=337810 RepID=UPI003F761C2B
MEPPVHGTPSAGAPSAWSPQHMEPPAYGTCRRMEPQCIEPIVHGTPTLWSPQRVAPLGVWSLQSLEDPSFWPFRDILFIERTVYTAYRAYVVSSEQRIQRVQRIKRTAYRAYSRSVYVCVSRAQQSETTKRQVLCVHFVPRKSWKGPLKVIGNKQRRVPNKILDKAEFPYMSYSVKDDCVFCTACSIFAKSSAAVPFIREGHSDWSNIMRHAERHNKSPIHLSAVSDALAFKHICDGKNLSIKQSLSKAYAEQVARNRAALVSIVKIICLCGKHRLRSEHDTVLREHLKLASKNSQYISHRIQNEIISIIGSQIRETILTPCREAKYFSVIVDETTDISVKEQVALVVLYVTSDGSRHEEFVTFEETADTTGETLYKLICNKLEDFGLDKNKVVGLGFDGASNMSGKIKGVQARFVNDVPTVEYVHCRAHCLNLAITQTCKETSVRNLYSVVGEIVKFINASAKRLHIYTSQNEDADRLKKFCATRWGCHEETLGVFLNKIENIIDTLHFIRENDTDPSTAAKAGAFFMNIHCFQFLTTLVIVHHYLNLTKPLSMALQSKTNNLIKATQECKELVEMLKSKRSDGSSFEHLYRKATQLAADLQVDEKHPRSICRQKNRENDPSTTSAEFFERNLHNPFLDHLIVQLNERICGSTNRVRAEMLLPQNLASLSEEDIAVIKEAYSPFIRLLDLDAEVERWKWRHKDGGPLKLEECIQSTRYLYPNLNNIFTVLITMPVSTASAERSFSTLWLLID